MSVGGNNFRSSTAPTARQNEWDITGDSATYYADNDLLQVTYTISTIGTAPVNPAVTITAKDQNGDVLYTAVANHDLSGGTTQQLQAEVENANVAPAYVELSAAVPGAAAREGQITSIDYQGTTRPGTPPGNGDNGGTAQPPAQPPDSGSGLDTTTLALLGAAVLGGGYLASR